MIPIVNEDTSTVLDGSYTMSLTVESWRNGTLLSYDIPVSAGYEDVDRTARVPERITLTVPRLKDGIDWTPAYDSHPLAANGQRLRILVGVAGVGTQIEWLQRGWFVISESEVDGDSVIVTGLGLLSLIDEARLVSPYQPTGTIGSTIRGLIEPALTVDLTSAPADRAVPSDMNIDEDRLDGVLRLLDAWGADGYVTPDGHFKVVSSGDSSTADLSLTSLLTTFQVDGSSTRDNGYNVVVARGTATDGGLVQGVAYETTGPKAYGGSFSPLAVPYFYSSPLLTTVAQCNTAAATVLTRLRRTYNQRYQVQLVPNPRIEAGDTAAMLDMDGAPKYIIEALHLPYTADGGAMTLLVRGPV